MSKIPESILDIARRTAIESYDPVGQRWYTQGIVDAVSKAIWAERKKCAKIAEDMYLDQISDKDMRGVRERHEWVCRDISPSHSKPNRGMR